MVKELSLEEYVKSKFGGIRYRELRKLYDEVRSGRLTLVDVNPPNDFLGHIIRLEYSLWFWSVVAVTSVTILSVALSDYVWLLKYVRYVFGTIYVLFIPGYVTVEALYPRERDLTPLERLAFSIGLSLALVPLIGLLLNYSPWGIRLTPVMITLTAYSILTAAVGLYRKRQALNSGYTLK
ncbi:MAG: DUF1616 domain-containing protein [Sulfolobales archaeon]|nr:DUF1616 domain-containing protein [Sulfolobales archaeon]MCX8186893.1 DUF1616 domain-containing protein [Sulfolobales archaeon]